MVLNVFALKQNLCLSRPVPLAIIIGHESRHLLERQVEGDMNFSTPDKMEYSLPSKNHESGLEFGTPGPDFDAGALVALAFDHVCCGVKI